MSLTDAQIQAGLQSFIAANGPLTGMSTAYFVFFPIDVGSCFDSTSSSCTYKQFCAYHGWIGNGDPSTIVYANMPYADQPSAGTRCDIEPSRNGNDADATINVTSHEHNEMITDPLGNAWYDSVGDENADKCAWMFGNSLQVRGVNASFTIVSATKITTRVPAGVMGLAQWTVTTPGGTAKSGFICAC